MTSATITEKIPLDATVQTVTLYLRRNYQPKERSKVRRQRNRAILSALLLALAISVLASGMFILGKRAIKLANDFRRPGWSYWTVKSVKVAGLGGETSAAVSAFAGSEHGRRYISEDCAMLAESIANRFPELRKVAVTRNWLSGALVVKAEERRAVALLVAKDNAAAYFDENGELYRLRNTPASEWGLTLRVPYLPTTGKISTELLALMEFISISKNSFPAAPVELQLSSDQEALSITLADGSVVDWGSFAFAPQKLEKLGKIYRSATQRISGPLYINMRYFEDGSASVSTLENTLHTKHRI